MEKVTGADHILQEIVMCQFLILCNFVDPGKGLYHVLSPETAHTPLWKLTSHESSFISSAVISTDYLG